MLSENPCRNCEWFGYEGSCPDNCGLKQSEYVKSLKRENDQDFADIESDLEYERKENEQREEYYGFAADLLEVIRNKVMGVPDKAKKSDYVDCINSIKLAMEDSYYEF